MNIVLWVFQILLAGVYGMAGGMKVFKTDKAKQTMPWANGHSDNYVRFIGTVELMGALGVLLPILTGILPWLTPLAAIGLALIQLLAILTEHLPKKEYKVLPINLILLTLAVFVIIGRWVLVA